MIRPNGDVIAVYGGFQQGRLDTISHLQLDERMRRLTSRDLQSLESSVPLKTVKAVVDLAVQIGREGREGKPVGTIFVVGDTRHVLEHSTDGGAIHSAVTTRKFAICSIPKCRTMPKKSPSSTVPLSSPQMATSNAAVRCSKSLTKI